MQINQSAIERVIKYLNERKDLLNKLKGEDISIEMLKLEIASIETTLLLLGIEFKNK